MWDVRVNGMIQGSDVAGRDYTTDDRSGIAGNIVYKPDDKFALTANYSNTWIYGLPDFGVPYNQVARRPVTSGDVPRFTYYGITNRDFTKTIQKYFHGTRHDAVWKLSDSITPENKVRQGFSLLVHISWYHSRKPQREATPATTAPFSSTLTFFSGYIQLNAQSRYETVYVFGDQPQATITFGGGRFKNTAIVGGDFGAEHVSIDSYAGFTSELTTGPVAFTSTGAPIVSVYNPPHSLFGSGVAHLTGNPLRYGVATTAAAGTSSIRRISATSSSSTPAYATTTTTSRPQTTRVRPSRSCGHHEL